MPLAGAGMAMACDDCDVAGEDCDVVGLMACVDVISFLLSVVDDDDDGSSGPCCCCCCCFIRFSVAPNLKIGLEDRKDVVVVVLAAVVVVDDDGSVDGVVDGGDNASGRFRRLVGRL